MSNPTSEHPLFGEVISVYTRAQALADGVLIDAGAMAAEAGFRFPVAITAAAWADCVAWDDADRRTLFEYHDWIGWQPAALSALGKLLDLDMRYFHSGEAEWLPLEEGIDTSDVRENNSFIMFSRP